MAETKKNGLLSRIQLGPWLITATIVLLALAVFLGWYIIEDVGPRVVVVLLILIAIALVWGVALRNNKEEREFRARLVAEHPGALVERVRLWALPHGRVEPGTPMHFLIADASEISFETVHQTVLLRIPVADLGLIDLVTAQGDRVKDKALTLIYGDDESVVQLFTITYDATGRLESRLRKAIGWPATGTPDPA